MDKVDARDPLPIQNVDIRIQATNIIDGDELTGTSSERQHVPSSVRLDFGPERHDSPGTFALTPLAPCSALNEADFLLGLRQLQALMCRYQQWLTKNSGWHSATTTTVTDGDRCRPVELVGSGQQPHVETTATDRLICSATAAPVLDQEQPELVETVTLIQSQLEVLLGLTSGPKDAFPLAAESQVIATAFPDALGAGDQALSIHSSTGGYSRPDSNDVVKHILLQQRISALESSEAALRAERDRLSSELATARHDVTELEDELDRLHDHYQGELVSAQRQMAAQVQVDWDTAQRRALEQKKADVEQVTKQLERRYQAAYIEELRKTQKKFNDDLEMLNRRYTEGSLHQLSITAVSGASSSLGVVDVGQSSAAGCHGAEEAGSGGLIEALTLKQQDLEKANRAISKELEAAHRLNEIMSEEVISLRLENDNVTGQLGRLFVANRSGSTSSKDSSAQSTLAAAAAADSSNHGDTDLLATPVMAAASAHSEGSHRVRAAERGLLPRLNMADATRKDTADGMGSFVAESPSQEDVYGVQSLLNSAHRELFDRMQQHWQKVHREELVQLDADRQTLPFSLDVMRSICVEYKYEIHLQLESLKTTMQQTYNGQIELLKNSCADEVEQRVEDVVRRLSAEHQLELDALQATWKQRLEQISVTAAGPSASCDSAVAAAATLATTASYDGLSCLPTVQPEATGEAKAAPGSVSPPAHAGTETAAVQRDQEESAQQQQQRQQRSDSAASVASAGSLTTGAGHWRQRSNGGSGYEDDIEDWGVDEAVLADDAMSPRRFMGGSPLSADAAAAAALRERDYFKKAATLTIISDLDSGSEDASPRDSGPPDDVTKTKVSSRSSGVGECCRRALASAIAERQAHVERAERERDRIWEARIDALSRAHEAELDAYRCRPESAAEEQLQLAITSGGSSADVSFEARAIQASLKRNGITSGRMAQYLRADNSFATSEQDALADSEALPSLRGHDAAALDRLRVMLEAELAEREQAIRSECRTDMDELIASKGRELNDQAEHTQNLLTEAEHRHRLDVVALKQLHELELEALKREHLAALQEAGREWQERMDDALHAAALDSDRLANELDYCKGAAAAAATTVATSTAAASPADDRCVAAPTTLATGPQSGDDRSNSNGGQLLEDSTVAAWRQSMSALMAEQQSIREENAARLDELRQTYEQQLVGLQSTVERLLHEGADKDDTIRKLTAKLSATDAGRGMMDGTLKVTEQEAEHINGGQNGRRLVQQTDLVQQLRDDVQLLQAERDTAQQNVDKLLQLLATAVQQQQAAGECISRHLGSCAGSSSRSEALHRAMPNGSALRDSSSPVDEKDCVTPAALLCQSPRGSTPRGHRRRHSRSQEPPLEKSLDDTVVSDEGLDLSLQKINESFLALLDLDSDGDEVVTDAGRTLQTSVDRLLEVLEQTRRQLAEARGARDELLGELLSRSDDAERARTAADSGLRAERDELAEKLAHETATSHKLALELHSAEGVVDGYIADRERHEEALREAQVLRSQLEAQCATLRARVQLLEEQRADAEAAQRLAQRQHEAMAAASDTDEATAEADASDVAQPALLRQNSQLDREKHEMSRQYEKDRRRLLDRIRELEQKVEDVSKANDELLEQSQTDKHDLELQLDALERQLRASKLFIEEQTHDREAEREEYQRDTRKYQAVLDEKRRLEATLGKLQSQIADLESQLQDAEGNDSGHHRRRRGSALGEFDDSPHAVQIDQLRKVVRYLEVELETKSSQENELKERLVSMEAELVALTGLNGDLEAELKQRRQLEAMSHSASASVVEDLQEQVSLSASQLAALRQERDALAAELDRQRGADEELTHENNALRKQVNELLLQESALKSKLDSLKPSYHMGGGSMTSGGAGSVMADGHMAPSSGRLLHERVLACEEALEKRAAQIVELTEQLADAREQLAARDVHLSAVADRLAVDREHAEAGHAAAIQELQSLLQAARDDNRDLLLELNALKHTPSQIPAYAQKIIAEKNEEIDHLNAQMAQLKDSMADSAVGKAECELAELRAQLQRKDDAIQEKEEELFAATEELLAVQQQLEAIQGGNSFAQEEAAAHQLQLEETVSDLQQQLALSTQTLEETRAAHAHTLLDLKRSEERKLNEMTALHANEVRTARQTEAEKWQAEVTAARQASDGVVSQLRALLDEKEATLRKMETALSQASELARGDHERTLADVKRQLQETGRLLSEKEELVRSLSREKTRLAQARTSLEGELSWHKLELQEKEKLVSLLQQRPPQLPGEAPEELRAQLAAAVRSLETERAERRAEQQSWEERLSAAARQLEAEQLRAHTSEVAYGEQIKECKVEAEQQLGALQQELSEVKKELAAAAREAQVSREKMFVDAKAEYEQTLRAAVASVEHGWQERLERERAEHGSHLRELQATHQATLTATVDEVKQNLKKAYRRHLASVLRTNRLNVEEPLRRNNGGSSESRHSSTASDSVSSPPALDGRTPPAGASAAAGSSSVMQQLLNQALVQGSEILALSNPSVAWAPPAPDAHGWDADKPQPVGACADAKQFCSATPSAAASHRSRRSHDRNGVAGTTLSNGSASLAGLSGGDDDAELDRLEERVQSLASRQAAAVDALLAADRSSLLGEIRELRAHLDLSRAQHAAVVQRLRDDLDEARRCTTSRERQLQQELQLAEYRSTQEKMELSDVRGILDAERQSAEQLSEQLSAERGRCSSLAADIKALAAEVGQLEQTVAWRDQQLSSLRRTIDVERGEHRERVAELQRREQRILDELQRLTVPRQRPGTEDASRAAATLEQEAASEKLKRELAAEKVRCSDASLQADAERRRVAELRAQLDGVGAEHRRVEAMYKDLVSDLQAQLEEERATGRGFASRLEEEHEEIERLRSRLAAAEERAQAAEEAGAEEATARWRSQVDQLHALLDRERGRCAELQATLDREATLAALTGAAADAERRRLGTELDVERAVCGKLKQALDAAEGQCQESAKKAISDGEKIKQLTNELDRMRSRVNSLQQGLEMAKQQQQQQRRLVAGNERPSRTAHGEQQAVQHAASDRLQQHEAHQDASRTWHHNGAVDSHEGTAASLPASMAISYKEARHPGYSSPLHRSADEVTAGVPAAGDLHLSSSSRRQPLGGSAPVADTIAAFRQQLEDLRQRLRRATLHLQGAAGTSGADPAAAVTDLREIADELNHLHGAAATSLERLATSPSLLSAASLDDIVRHNGELARFVAKLSEEKAELREALANLEEEVWLYRQRSTAEGESTGSAPTRMLLTATCRAASAIGPEVSALTASLVAAENRAQRAEEKLRSFHSRASEAEAAASAPTTERRLKERLHRAHSAWLRAESLRKSLVFQKRYLLLLLGGFQECEAATLQAISQMGAASAGLPPRAAETWRRAGRGAARFRSAVYAISAIRRLKILVSKWGKVSSLAAASGAVNGQVHGSSADSNLIQPLVSTSVRSRVRAGDGMDAIDDDPSPVNPRTSGTAKSHTPSGHHVAWSSSLTRPVLQHRRDMAASDRSVPTTAVRHAGHPSSDSCSDGTTPQRGDRRRTSSSSHQYGGKAADGEPCFRPAMLSASHILRPSSTSPAFRGKPTSDVPELASTTAPSTARRIVDGGASSSGSRSSSDTSPKFSAEWQRSAEITSGRGSATGDRPPSAQLLRLHTARSPTAGSSNLSDDGSVDSQYLRRLESLQQQLAADLHSDREQAPLNR